MIPANAYRARYLAQAAECFRRALATKGAIQDSWLEDAAHYERLAYSQPEPVFEWWEQTTVYQLDKNRSGR